MWVGILVDQPLSAEVQKSYFSDKKKSQESDKSQHHFLNPTPHHLMREMATDRPDKTESPYTVDAGHYQIEVSFLDYTYDKNNPDKTDTKVETFKITPINFKVGLCNNVDFQFVMEPHIAERTKADGEIQRKNGFGDIQTRLKINMWGNDGGSTALAIMPFVKFPTNQSNLGNDALEGGLIIPFAVKLPHDWDMGFMTEFDAKEDSASNDYHAEFINTITVGHEIIGDLNGYIEFFSSVSSEVKSKWIGTVDTGLTYAITNNIQLDMGVNIGITKSANDFNPFLGLSMRY